MTVIGQAVARALLLPTWMIAFAMLVKGYVETGDGFSAGVIAALGVLIQYLAFGTDVAEKMLPVRYATQLAAVGLLLSLAVAFLPVAFGDPVMTHWPPVGDKPVHLGSLELISAVTFDIGVFLLVVGFCIGVIDLIAHLTPERSR